eukprot:m51a1_g9949 hypothetical protein (440) ;mRNA; r:21722-23458
MTCAEVCGAVEALALQLRGTDADLCEAERAASQLYLAVESAIARARDPAAASPERPEQRPDDAWSPVAALCAALEAPKWFEGLEDTELYDAQAYASEWAPRVRAWHGVAASALVLLGACCELCSLAPSARAASPAGPAAARLVLCCSAYASERAAWSCPSARSAATGALARAAAALGLPGGAAELTRRALGAVLEALAPRLAGDKWTRDPYALRAAVAASLPVRHPHLSQHAGALVPLAVAVLGAASAPTQLLGASLLSHCARELNAAELQRFADVVAAECSSALHTRDERLLREVVPCAASCAAALDRAEHTRRASLALLDELVRQSLFRTENDSRPVVMGGVLAVLRSVGAEAIPALKTVVPAALEGLAFAPSASQLVSLSCLGVLLRTCWPRMASKHLSVLRALCDAYTTASRRLDAGMDARAEGEAREVLDAVVE